MSQPDEHSFIEITPKGELRVKASSVSEAKLAIKELKLKKKEYSVKKREITNRQQQIRAAYTDKVRRQGSKVRGGGGLGRFIRNVQTANRDIARSNLAKQLAPLEEYKAQIDSIMSAIDKAILHVEAYILKNS